MPPFNPLPTDIARTTEIERIEERLFDLRMAGECDSEEYKRLDGEVKARTVMALPKPEDR